MSDDAAPHVTVATLVERDGQWLFVEEKIGGNTVINQPAGHWEAGESLIEAATRETLEETRWHVEPVALVGIYSYHPPGLPYPFLRFAFLATAIEYDTQRALDPAIERAIWLSPEALAERADEHRSPMVQRGVDDALAGHRLSLEWLQHLAA